jgi:hypothetical protein
MPFRGFGDQDFATSDVEKRSSQPVNLRMHDTREEALIQWSSYDLDPMVILAPCDFATRDLEHPTLGLSPCEPPSSRDPLISATCPPQTDGSDLLATSPLTKSRDFLL